jgi:hypothetical protein
MCVEFVNVFHTNIQMYTQVTAKLSFRWRPFLKFKMAATTTVNWCVHISYMILIITNYSHTKFHAFMTIWTICPLTAILMYIIGLWHIMWTCYIHLFSMTIYQYVVTHIIMLDNKLWRIWVFERYISHTVELFLARQYKGTILWYVVIACDYYNIIYTVS